MSFSDIVMILPLLVPAAGIVVIMLVLTVYRSHSLTLALTVATLGLSLAVLPISASTESRRVTALLIVDNYALLYAGMIFGAAIAVCFLAYGYMRGRRNIKEEFYILVVAGALGCTVIVASSHFVSFFLGLELLSVSLYVLIAYLRSEYIHIEAGIKYLIPAATSVAFLLLGAAFIYTAFGSMEFFEIAYRAGTAVIAGNTLFIAGLALVAVGIGFKLALVPFHLWTPDVYQGAPAPVTAFIATGSKGAIFALFVRYFTALDVYDYGQLFTTFVVLAIVTMFFGNLLALMQLNVKRILAYSSIAHMGYLLTALLAGGRFAKTAVALYLLTYFVATLGAFGVIAVLSNKERDMETLDDYRGVVSRHPCLAGVFTAMLLSLAGIPLTAGFIGKFYIFFTNVDGRLWLLLAALVINSVIGLFYYLRVIAALYWAGDVSKPTGGPEAAGRLWCAPSLSFTGGLVLALLTVLVLLLGVYPGPLIEFVTTMASG